MAVSVGPGDLDDPQLVALLTAHLAQMREITPPESTHALDLAGLRRPDVRLWVAHDAVAVVGCVALRHLDPEHAELKSMRTAPERTGEGIGTALLRFVVRTARHDGVRRISLETGSGEFFAPARRLYARHGFAECAPFAAYAPDPLSTFMTRVL